VRYANIYFLTQCFLPHEIPTLEEEITSSERSCTGLGSIAKPRCSSHRTPAREPRVLLRGSSNGFEHVEEAYVGVLPLKVGSCGRDRPQDVDFSLRRSCLVVKSQCIYPTCAPFSLSSLFVTHDFYRACTAGFPTSCWSFPPHSGHTSRPRPGARPIDRVIGA
jgi:hypothetical protein